MSPMTKVYLQKAVDSGNKKCPYVFQDNGHLKHSIVRKRFAKFCKSLKIDGLTFHGLRHNYATYFLYSGGDIKTLQSNLGHSSPEFTLDRYSHIIDEQKQSTAETFCGYIQDIIGKSQTTAEKEKNTVPDAKNTVLLEVRDMLYKLFEMLQSLTDAKNGIDDFVTS
jgi:hypothetical protein